MLPLISRCASLEPPPPRLSPSSRRRRSKLASVLTAYTPARALAGWRIGTGSRGGQGPISARAGREPFDPPPACPGSRADLSGGRPADPARLRHGRPPARGPQIIGVVVVLVFLVPLALHSGTHVEPNEFRNW